MYYGTGTNYVTTFPANCIKPTRYMYTLHVKLYFWGTLINYLSNCLYTQRKFHTFLTLTWTNSRPQLPLDLTASRVTPKLIPHHIFMNCLADLTMCGTWITAGKVLVRETNEGLAFRCWVIMVIIPLD